MSRSNRNVARAALAALLAASLAACGLTAPRSSDGYADLDSLGLVEMLFEVEDRYGFQIKEPMRYMDMTFDEMVSDIEQAVRDHHGGRLPEDGRATN